MNNPQLKYTGVDVLHVLDEATNYNALLLDLILRSADGRRRMLDFGAGIGTFSKLLRNRGIDVTCVEPDAHLADALSRERFTVFRDLDQLPDGSFEFIFTLNVLEHIENDQTTVCHLADKLTSGGRLLVYVPAFELLWTSLDDKVKHYRRYRRTELEQLTRATTLSVLETRYADSLGFFATLGFKLFGNKSGDLTSRAVRLYDCYLVPASRVLDRLLGRVLGKNVYIIATNNTHKHVIALKD